MMNEFEFYPNGVLKRHERMIYDPNVMGLEKFPDSLKHKEWLEYSYLEETIFWENGNPKNYSFYFKHKKGFEQNYDSAQWKFLETRGAAFFAVNWTDSLVVGDTFSMLFLCINPPLLSKRVSVVDAVSKKALKGTFRWISKNWVLLEFIVTKEGESSERLMLELSDADSKTDTIYSNIFKYFTKASGVQ
jgi:hypothetical protein